MLIKIMIWVQIFEPNWKLTNGNWNKTNWCSAVTATILAYWYYFPYIFCLFQIWTIFTLLLRTRSCFTCCIYHISNCKLLSIKIYFPTFLFYFGQFSRCYVKFSFYFSWEELHWRKLIVQLNFLSFKHKNVLRDNVKFCSI